MQPFLLFLLALIFNYIPAFTPPTSLLLTYFYVQTNENIIFLTLLTIFGALAGRVLLYITARFLGVKYLAEHVQEGYVLLRHIVHKNDLLTLLSMSIYCVSPLPTNAVFMIAGVAKIKLIPISLGFLIGRFIQYLSIAVSVKTIYFSFQDVIGGTFINPYSLILSLLAIIIELVSLFIDWENLILHKRLTFHKKILKK